MGVMNVTHMTEKYTYELSDRQRVLQTCEAETLTEAIEQLCPGAKVDYEAHFMAVITENDRRSFGITWGAKE